MGGYRISYYAVQRRLSERQLSELPPLTKKKNAMYFPVPDYYTEKSYIILKNELLKFCITSFYRIITCVCCFSDINV